MEEAIYALLYIRTGGTIPVANTLGLEPRVVVFDEREEGLEVGSVRLRLLACFILVDASDTVRRFFTIVRISCLCVAEC